MKTYLILAVCLLAGQVFHLLIKGNSMRKRAKAANMPFNIMRDFIATDALEIAATFVGGIIVMLVLTELRVIYPAIENYLRILFVLLGYSGSSLVLAALSKGEKKITKEIDVKTDKLDEITNMEHWVFYPALTSSNDEILTVGNQQYDITAGNMSAQTQGLYYTQTINQQLFLCAEISAFTSPLTANIRKTGTQQTGYHDPIKRPK